MPFAHQLILGVIVAGFIVFPVGLLWVWVWSRGWEYDRPDVSASGAENRPALDRGQGATRRKAA